MNKHEVMQWIKGHKKEVIVGSLTIVGSVVLGITLGRHEDDIVEDVSPIESTPVNNLHYLDVSNFTIGEWAEAGYWEDKWDGYFGSIVNEVPLEKLGEFGQMIIDNCEEFGPEDRIQAIMDIRRYYPGD